MAGLYQNPMFGQGLEAIASALSGGNPMDELTAAYRGAAARNQASQAALNEGELGGRTAMRDAFTAGGDLNALIATGLGNASMDPKGLGAVIPSLLATYSGGPARDQLDTRGFSDILLATGTQGEPNTPSGHANTLANRSANARIAAGPGYARVAEMRRQHASEPMSVFDAVTGRPVTIRAGDFDPALHMVPPEKEAVGTAYATGIYDGEGGGLNPLQMRQFIGANPKQDQDAFTYDVMGDHERLKARLEATQTQLDMVSKLATQAQDGTIKAALEKQKAEITEKKMLLEEEIKGREIIQVIDPRTRDVSNATRGSLQPGVGPMDLDGWIGDGLGVDPASPALAAPETPSPASPAVNDATPGETLRAEELDAALGMSGRGAVAPAEADAVAAEVRSEADATDAAVQNEAGFRAVYDAMSTGKKGGSGSRPGFTSGDRSRIEKVLADQAKATGVPLPPGMGAKVSGLAEQLYRDNPGMTIGQASAMALEKVGYPVKDTAWIGNNGRPWSFNEAPAAAPAAADPLGIR